MTSDVETKLKQWQVNYPEAAVGHGCCQTGRFIVAGR